MSRQNLKVSLLCVGYKHNVFQLGELLAMRLNIKYLCAAYQSDKVTKLVSKLVTLSNGLTSRFCSGSNTRSRSSHYLFHAR